jgi:GTP pyrophosphokinase
VEIITSNEVRVEPSWLEFATTAKAKNKIEAYLRRRKREYAKTGEERVSDWFAKHELEMNSMMLDRLCNLHGKRTREDFFAVVGDGTLVLTDGDLQAIQRKADGQDNNKQSKNWRKFIPFMKKKPHEDSSATGAPTAEEPLIIDKKKPVILTDDNLSRFVMCPHCHPIPGDDVLGYLDDQNHVIIHKRQCPVANKLKTSQGNSILAVQWDMHKQTYFPATIHIEGIDRIGILRSLTDVLTQQFNVNIRHLTINTHDGIFQGDIELLIHDTSDVETIIKNLKGISDMESVTRVS